MDELCTCQSWSKRLGLVNSCQVLGPLFLRKMMLRALITPCVSLVQWRLSELPPARDANDARHLQLRGLGLPVSLALDPMQHFSTLVTMLEMAMLWGMFIPLLLPFVSLAIASNMMLLAIGPSSHHRRRADQGC